VEILECLRQSMQASEASEGRGVRAVGAEAVAEAGDTAGEGGAGAKGGGGSMLRVWLSSGGGLRDCCGRSPVHWACRAGDEQIVECLLAAGASGGKGASVGCTPAFPFRLHSTDDHGDTPLHEAARFGRAKVVEGLLRFEKAATAEAMSDGLRQRRNNQGQTAADLASHPDVTACLRSDV
jgi:hypothetical protein